MRVVSILGLFFFACASTGRPLVIKDPGDSTEAARLEAYESYRAKELVAETALQEDGTYAETGRVKALILNTGEEVKDPTQLLGAVPPGTESNKAIEAYQKKQKRERVLRVISLSGLTAVTTGLIVGFSLSNPDDTLTPAGSATVIVSGLALTGLAVPALMRLSATYDKKRARSEAFSFYDEALRTRWDLCEEGEQIFDCAKAPDFAAEVIAFGGDVNQSPFERCRESEAIGESLSEECQVLLRRGAPQKAPDPEAEMPAPDPVEQEFSLLLSLAEVRMRAEKYAAATSALEEARRLKPEESIIEFALGEILRSQGDSDGACAHYRSFLRSPGDNIDNIEKVKTYLAGVNKTKHKACQFNPEKP